MGENVPAGNGKVFGEYEKGRKRTFRERGRSWRERKGRKTFCSGTDGTAAARTAGAAATARPGAGSSTQRLSSPGGRCRRRGALRAGEVESAADRLGRELSPVRARPKSLGPPEDNSSPALWADDGRGPWLEGVAVNNMGIMRGLFTGGEHRGGRVAICYE